VPRTPTSAASTSLVRPQAQARPLQAGRPGGVAPPSPTRASRRSSPAGTSAYRSTPTARLTRSGSRRLPSCIQRNRRARPKQNEMATIGTTHIVTIMNDHDLLPTHNFRYGSHREAPNLGQAVYRRLFDPGYDGCRMGCTWPAPTGCGISSPERSYRGRKCLSTGPSMKPSPAADPTSDLRPAHRD
jgi:hypothetical protein